MPHCRKIRQCTLMAHNSGRVKSSNAVEDISISNLQSSIAGPEAEGLEDISLMMLATAQRVAKLFVMVRCCKNMMPQFKTWMPALPPSWYLKQNTTCMPLGTSCFRFSFPAMVRTQGLSKVM